MNADSTSSKHCAWPAMSPSGWCEMAGRYTDVFGHRFPLCSYHASISEQHSQEVALAILLLTRRLQELNGRVVAIEPPR